MAQHNELGKKGEKPITDFFDIEYNVSKNISYLKFK